ncbi:MAG: HDIG domain-containing protein [Methanomicrobiales archaeon]|nr:HDIG domain-containing protein [Methanomicrobiales archaeon]
MSEDPDGISRTENAKDDSPSENRRGEAPVVNHRAERGGDPEGINPGENQQTEGLVVNARAEARARSTEQSEVLKWEALLLRAGCDRRVIAHARAVTAVALTFSESPLVDRDLVRAGAMLHDIGRGVTHGISHAQRGAELARSFGLDPAIVSIIGRHIGAGLTADECSLQGLVPRDCVPVTLEEKIVANADNLVHGDRAASIERTLGASIRLKKRVRRRICRLYLEMEVFRS